MELCSTTQSVVIVYVNDGFMTACTARTFVLDGLDLTTFLGVLRNKFAIFEDLPIQLYVIHQTPEGRVITDLVTDIRQLANSECIMCLGSEPLLLPMGYDTSGFPSLYPPHSHPPPPPPPPPSHHHHHPHAHSRHPHASSSAELAAAMENGNNAGASGGVTHHHPIPYDFTPHFPSFTERLPEERKPQKRFVMTESLCSEFGLSIEQAQALEEFDSWHVLQMKYYKKSKALVAALQLCGRSENVKKATRVCLMESVQHYEEFVRLAAKLGWKTKNMNGAFIRHQLLAEANVIDPSFLERWEAFKLEPGQNRQTLAAQAAREMLAGRDHPLGMAAAGGRPSKSGGRSREVNPENYALATLAARKKQRGGENSPLSDDDSDRGTQGMVILSAIAEANLVTDGRRAAKASASEQAARVRRGKRPSFYRSAEAQRASPSPPSCCSTSSSPIPFPAHPVYLTNSAGQQINLCVALANTLDPIGYLCDQGKEVLSNFLASRGYVPGTSLKHLASTLFLYWVRCSCPIARRHLASLGTSLQDLPPSAPVSTSTSSASLYQAMSDLKHFVADQRAA